MSNAEIGALGEKVAAAYLKKKRYKILETNYSTKCGEIDIIAQKDDAIIFIEVKTKSSLEYLPPSIKVNKVKQRKYKLVANIYLLHKKIMPFCRFDVVEVFDNKVINHFENAFYV